MHKILLINLLLSLGIGIVAFFATQALPKNGDLGEILSALGLLLIGLQILACWVIAIVYFVKKDAGRGAGFLLSGFIAGAIGFGTCSAILMFSLAR